MENSYRFFQNRDCKYFPCHKTKDDTEFNCLFCYCPLYTLGDKCGGNCSYTHSGIKNCTDCTLPHHPKGYDYILKMFSELAELAKANRKENEE